MRVMLAAGGTGGHLFPAQALAGELRRRGHAVTLVTDRRAQPLLDDFPANAVHFVPAATLRGRGPFALARMLLRNGAGLARCLALLRAAKADAAVGFGGYPTLPPLTAAQLLRVPCVVHEANAVVGRANRRLARHAHVATSFPQVKGLPATLATTHVGIPVRAGVLAAVRPYAPSDGPFRLLVFGGSQGARAFADLVPPAVAALAADARSRLTVVQQARPEDEARVREAYRAAGVAAEVAPFFRDLPERMAAAHLVVARAGASTVAELAVIGRPSLLVPLPAAIDQDQAHNADALAALGGARRLDQDGLTPAHLSEELVRALAAPDALAEAAQAARRLARPDAARHLADLVERIAGPQAVEAAATAQGDPA